MYKSLRQEHKMAGKYMHQCEHNATESFREP